MLRDAINDPLLRVKSEIATKDDLQMTQDLLDMLIFNKGSCVGMAANMLGVCKQIVVFYNDGPYTTMFNPEIIKKLWPYDAEEGGLSLLGDPRKCKCYQTIKVQWQIA